MLTKRHDTFQRSARAWDDAVMRSVAAAAVSTAVVAAVALLASAAAAVSPWLGMLTLLALFGIGLAAA